MPIRFDKYRLRDGVDFNAALWNGIFQDLDRRIATTEDKQISFDVERQKLVDAALNRLDELLSPVVGRLEEYASLGALLTAFSDSTIEVGDGIKVFTVVEDDREKFAAPGYLSILKTGEPAQAMLGTLVAYDAATGSLTVQVDRFTGSGFHAGWTISAASATDNAEAAELAAAARAEAEVFAGQALARRNEATAARDQALVYLSEVDSDAEAADDARIQAQIAQAAAEAAAGNAQNFMRGFLGTFTDTRPTTRTDGSALQVGDWIFRAVSGSPVTYFIDFVSTVGPVAWRSLTAASDTSVSSFNGRVGGVTPAAGDYTAAQINGTAPSGLSGTTVQAIMDAIGAALGARALAATTLSGGGLATGGGDLSANRTITVPKSSNAQALAGADDTTAMTPVRVKEAILALTPAPVDATTSVKGIVQLATNVETTTGTNTTKATTPAGVKAAVDAAVAALLNSAPGALDTLQELASALGNDPNFATTITNALSTKLNAAAYTPADVLAKLLTVDGPSSGLDADTLDGLQAAAFALLTGAAYTGPVTITTDSAGAPLTLTRYGAGANQFLRRYNGTVGAPTAVTVGDVLASLTMQGWDGSAFINAGYARMTVGSVGAGRVTAAWAWGTMNAAGALADRMTLDSEGNLNASGSVSSGGVPLALSNVAISPGTGMAGGGNLTASRTLSFDTAWGDARYATIAAAATVAQYRANSGGGYITPAVAWGAMAEVALTDAATIAVDLATGIDFTVTLAGNRTLGFPTNLTVGKRGRIRVVQDATGGRTLSYASGYVWSGGTVGSVDTTANRETFLDYDVVAAGKVRLAASPGTR